MKSATLAETRATSQSAVRAIRKPIGWIVPRIWIGSRSQLVRSTDGDAAMGLVTSDGFQNL